MLIRELRFTRINEVIEICGDFDEAVLAVKRPPAQVA
jgi:hypothetical protein